MGVVTRAHRTFALAAALTTSGAALAHAETPPTALRPSTEPTERLYGLTIAHLELDAPPGENVAELLDLTGLEEGRPLLAADLRRAVKVLYQLDRFDNVYALAERAQNAVSVRLVLPPRPRVQEIELIGAQALTEAEVEEALGLTRGMELDSRTFAERRESLAAAYRRIGHRRPAIGLAARPIDANGSHEVTVRIDEGPATRLRRTTFEGNPRLPLPLLARSTGLSRGDILDLGAVERALVELEADYRRRGYLEVALGAPEVREVQATTTSDEEPPPEADLILHVDAGPKVEIHFAGHSVISRRELDAAAEVLRNGELGHGAAALTEVVERILSRYERRGYWQAEVHPRVRTSPDGAVKQIVFAIREGRGSYVASMTFARPAAVARPAALADEKLRQKVLETVEDTLSEELGKPGADPNLVGDSLGDRSLPAPRDSPQPDTTSPDPEEVYVPRAYSAAAAAIEDLYRSEGYQTVTVGAPTIQVRGGELVDVRFDIQEGVRWNLGALSFAGNEAVPSANLLELTLLDPSRPGGEPLSFYNVEEARRAVLAHYQDLGHLYARVEESLREVPKRGSLSASEFVTTSTSAPLVLREICRQAEERGDDTCAVELVFRVQEGPEVRARNILVRGVESTSRDIVQDELAVHQGEVLRESDMSLTKTNLLRIGVFERVSVHPLDEKTEAPEKDVLCEVRERKHRSFEIGAGASTAEGVRVFAGYGHNNVFGTALKLQLNAKVNVQPFLILYDDASRAGIESFYDGFSTLERIEREVAVGVSYPRVFGLPPGFGAGIDVGVLHDLAVSYAQSSVAATLRFDYKGIRPVLGEKTRPLALQLKANFDRSELSCNPRIATAPGDGANPDDPCVAAGAGTEATTFYATVGPLVSFDLRDDPLNPSAGAYVELETSLAKGLTSSSTDFAKLEGTLSFYLPLPSTFGLAFSIFAGYLRELEDGGNAPVNRKYFAGGARTIRGYAEQSLFPQDVLPAEGDVTGGGHLVVALENELRFPISGPISGAVFFDIGDLWEDPTTFAIDENTRRSVGVGLRYATPVGPLSLDVGVPLVTRDPGEQGPTLHFSVRSF